MLSLLANVNNIIDAPMDCIAIEVCKFKVIDSENQVEYTGKNAKGVLKIAHFNIDRIALIRAQVSTTLHQH